MKIMRVVAVASRTGKYGGPFDTARGQVALIQDAVDDAVVFAGVFPDDAPRHDDRLVTAPVRHLLGLKSFVDVGSFELVRELARTVSQFDLVHVSMAREVGPIVAAVLALVKRKELIVQPHGMLTTSRRGTGHRILDALIVRPVTLRAMRVIALTQRERSELETWAPRLVGRINVIGNPPPRIVPTDTRPRGSGSDEQPADVLFAARLHPRKRVLDFADAAREASRRGWIERYVVLGPDEGDLSKLRERQKGVPNLEYGGVADQAGVLDRLWQSSAFVLTSNKEPWGNVLVAALSFGKPVVVTASSALSEMVDAYGAGRVVPDRDPIALAEAVHEVIDPDRRDDFSRGAIRCATDKLSAEIVRTDLLRTYFERN